MDEVLEEQVRYYRERAPEYDATSRPDGGDPFAATAQLAVDALRALGPVERAIELGPGTGAFTGVVAGVAEHVTAVDSSPEMLELNRRKVDAANVERVVGDVFRWLPDTPADLVVFTFLLSHVPSAAVETFWTAVGRMLAPGGRVFVMDETAHGLWREERPADDSEELVHRTLNDGRRFRIVKVRWEPDELAARLHDVGWDAQLERADPFFWGTIRRREQEV